MIVFFATLSASVLSPGQLTGKKSTTLKTNSSIPDEIKVIFEKSCMDCHAPDGKKLAMKHVNFSEWDNYKPAKQAKKAAAICKMITKKAMPPKSYRAKYPEAIPTATQKDMICKWSKTLALKK